MFDWMVWTTPVAVFFSVHRADADRHDGVGDQVAHHAAQGLLPIATTRGDRLFIGLLSAAYINLAFVGLAGASPNGCRWSRSPASGSASCCPWAFWRW
jgi:predicted small integral membrane protein